MLENGHSDQIPLLKVVMPTKERYRHNGGLRRELVRSSPKRPTSTLRYRAMFECPLDAYRGHGLISRSEYGAGLQFRKAYYAAVVCRRPSAHLHSDLERDMISEEGNALKQAYKILTPETRNTVINVCGHSSHSYSPQALEKLRKGLGHLAVQWNMAAIEICDHKQN